MSREKAGVSNLVFSACESVYEVEGSNIANPLGVPLLLRRFEGSGQHQGDDHSNQRAASLMRDLESATVTPTLGRHSDLECHSAVQQETPVGVAPGSIVAEREAVLESLT